MKTCEDGKIAAQKRYREKNREKRNAQKREYYKLNRESIRESQREYRINNMDKILAYNAVWQRKFWSNIRTEMLLAYGGECACCGEKEQIFLELDHIFNDGKKCREEAQNGRQEVLNLRKLGWPKERHQLLCSNCNHGKNRNKGICPHKTKNL